MNYSVVLTRSFKHSVKRLEKRFRHVKNDVRIAIQVLLQSPSQWPQWFQRRSVAVKIMDVLDETWFGILKVEGR